MRLTHEKLLRLWGLYGKGADAWIRMFPGGHDYSRPMREAALGFFDKYLKGEGAGSPVAEPAFATEKPDAAELYVLPDALSQATTMRAIARAKFDRAPAAATASTAADYIRLNGGLPDNAPPDLKVLDEVEGRLRIVFVSEPGLTVPALYWPAQGRVKALAVLVTEGGKARAAAEFDIPGLRRAGIACLAVDARGLGELEGLELRYTTYLGQAPAFGMGWDIICAAEAVALARAELRGAKLAVVGRGPTAGQAALAAALMERRVGFVAGLATLEKYPDAFGDDVPLLAVQPRANYAPPLAVLRDLLDAESVWSFLGGREPDWTSALVRWAQK
jgi:hypothetical protein